MPRISACASGLRTKATSCRPARRMSATNWPRPRISRSSSFRGRRAPTPCPAPGLPPEGNSRSLRTVMLSPIEPLTSLCRNGLRQDRRHRVVTHARAEAERRLQQAFGDDLVLLVVAEDKPADFLSEHG